MLERRGIAELGGFVTVYFSEQPESVPERAIRKAKTEHRGYPVQAAATDWAKHHGKGVMITEATTWMAE